MSEPKIIYEDKNFLAVNKPAGLLVHAAKIRDRAKTKINDSNLKQKNEPTLVEWLLRVRPEIAEVGDDTQIRPGIVHRLDRGTSGIMLIPKTQAYFEYLKLLFQEHEVKKQYLTVVWGKVKEKRGVIDKSIGIISGSLRRSVHSKKMQKTALTEYAVKHYFMLSGQEVSLLEVRPLTGRTHQIRIHLSSIGHPIVGDRLYGKNHPIVVAHQMLHAESIEFAIHPGQMIKLSAEVPQDFIYPQAALK